MSSQEFVSECNRYILHIYFSEIDIMPYGMAFFKSRNTGHSWIIILGSNGKLKTLHRHTDNDSYHSQNFPSQTIEEIIYDIICHDSWQLKGRPTRSAPIRYTYALKKGL